MNLSVKKVEANRNFANKVWNAGRFVVTALSTLDEAETGPRAGRSPIFWIRLQQLVRSTSRTSCWSRAQIQELAERPAFVTPVFHRG